MAQHVLEPHRLACVVAQAANRWSAVELDSPGQIGLNLRAGSWLSPASGL